MMTYFLDSHFDSDDMYSPVGNSDVKSSGIGQRDTIHLLKEKFEMPRYLGLVRRPRLEELLAKSIEQYPATLISGRAGTGKTALAAAFSRNQRRVAWYSVESSDIEWKVFANYFAASVLRAVTSNVAVDQMIPIDPRPSQATMAASLINLFAEAETELLHEPLLIVLDGIHHLFDAPWFGEFFSLLLSSLPENTHLLLLCRSKPPGPLWRLRSKQQLNVIDEKVLAFDLAETARVMKKLGFLRRDAERVHAETFGRISKLLERSDSEKK